MSEESFRAENSEQKTESKPEKSKKEKKVPRKVKSSTFASSLVAVIIIAAIIIGGGYYLQSQAANEGKEEAVTEVKDELQAQIDELNNQISDLEDKDKSNQELIERDLPEAAKVVEDCSQKFESEYAEFDEKIPFYLNYNNRPFQYYQKQGYRLKQACHSNEKVLLFLDSQKTYDNLIVRQVATPEVVRASAKVVLGLSDKMFFQMNYYPVKIENYNFFEDNKTFCIFDQFKDSQILYVCFNEGEEKQYVWYAFDSVKKLNKKVRVESDKKEVADETFEQDLLNLFSKKSFR